MIVELSVSFYFGKLHWLLLFSILDKLIQLGDINTNSEGKYKDEYSQNDDANSQSSFNVGDLSCFDVVNVVIIDSLDISVVSNLRKWSFYWITGCSVKLFLE